MTYTYKAFNQNSLGNLWVEGDASILKNFEVEPGYTDNRIVVNATLDGVVHQLVLTGAFSNSVPLISAADIKGLVTSSTSYKNGVLSESHEISPPISATEIVKLGTFVPEFYSGNDWFEGSSSASLSDVVTGLNGRDTFIGYGSGTAGLSKDYFYGGAGIDTSVYLGRLSEYVIKLEQQIWDGRTADGASTTGIEVIDQVSNRDGIDALSEVERLQFSDLSLALDTGKGEIAGSAYRLYKAAFDRLPEAEGLGFWINSLDQGADLVNVAQGFINSDEFRVMYGANPTDQQFVTLLYNHVLHRPPEGEGYQFWLNSLSAGVSRAQVLKDFSESTENINQTAELIANGIQYEPWIG